MSQVSAGIGDISSPPDKPAKPVTLREFGDAPATRKAIYDGIYNAASTLPAVSNPRHTLKLSNVQWDHNGEFSKKDRKDAILGGNTLGRKLRGTWELYDNASGKMIDSKEATVLRAPHMTDGGTFVHNGNEYVVKSQQRLRAGIFTREKENGEIESHANVLSGGPSHRYWLDPAKGVFYVKVGQANIPLLPLLQNLGAGEQEMRDAWGPDLYARNYQKGDGGATLKLADKFVGKKQGDQAAGPAIRAAFEGMSLDPEVTKRTLGQPYTNLGKDTLLAVTKKLLAVSRGEASPDDRDHLAFHKFVGPEDLFSERLTKDRAGVRRQLLFKASGKGNLQSMPVAALQQQLESVLLDSGLGQAVEEINPLEMLDKNTQMSRMGEGGIPSYDSIPDEAREVQPSHYGFVDSVRTPESFRAGVDTYLASNTRKGSDGEIYSQFKDLRTGQMVWKNPREIADTAVTFPGAMNQPGKRVYAIKHGRLKPVRKNEVSLSLPFFENSFSPLGNLVPLKSMIKGQRTGMASRMTTQAVPLVLPEAPLVQNAMPGTSGMRSYEDEYGKHVGALSAEKPGRVIATSPNGVIVKYDDGKIGKIDLHNNLPYNRKSFLTQTAVVQPGQRFGAGQLLARSNYTNEKGATALGANLKIAFLPWQGLNYEDAVVISESAAKKLSSEHAYQHQLPVGDKTRVGRNNYISLFPAKYPKKLMENIGEDGIVKVGTRVSYDDPLILGAEEAVTAQNKVHRKGSPAFKDVAVTWDHQDPGVVTDVVNSKDGPVVVVKSVHPMQVGDKLAGRYGNKGVVSTIMPDHQMPVGADGTPFEIVMNPLGVISRGNPAVWAEAKLGQIAEKLGHPVKIEDFDEKVPDRTAWVRAQMLKHGVPDTEAVTDPVKGTKIPDVFSGKMFVMKLSHIAEQKEQARGGGAYTAEGAPAKGSEGQSKRLAMQDSTALLAAGAYATLRDGHAVRGQRNDDWWLQYMQGHTPRDPKVPMVHEKFVNSLKAAGINVVPRGSQMHIMALTKKDIDHLAGDRNIQSGDTVNFDDDLKPIKGGLFSPDLTGAHHGTRWSAIQLNEPMPSPVMEEPIRRLLGLTQEKFENVLAGKEPLKPDGSAGPSAIAEALKGINVDREIAIARARIKSGTQGQRDESIRKLGYLKSAKQLDIHPSEWIWDRAPVIPPQFRPINVLPGKSKVPLVADANYLYRELHEANANLGNMKKAVGDGAAVGDERLAVYHALKAVTGLGEPITQASKDKQVRGILASVFGSSPKFGSVQRQLLSTTVDNVGRAVITPDPDLDMDSVGLPEDKAFEVYKRFIARRLRRSGMPIMEALRQVKDRTPLARKTLLEEMDQRPVIIDRAPVWHKFGVMAFRPVLSKGSTLRISPLITKGYTADFDGDMMNYHVPGDEAARVEALERLLPSRQLISPADFKTPVHVPTQEYVGGAFFATSPDFASKRPVRTFRNKKDVRAAWKSGEIGVNDPVRVLEK